MSPQDLTIFQSFAGLFTLSFMALSAGVLIYLYRLDAARSRVVGMVLKGVRVEEPVVLSLKAGAIQLRVASGQDPIHAQIEEPSDANQASR